MIPFLIHRASREIGYFGNACQTKLAPTTRCVGHIANEHIPIPFAVIGPQKFASNQGTSMGDYRARMHQLACGEWPRNDISSDYLLPVDSDVPVLMLSGDSDPATPMEFGKAAARHLTNSRQVLLRNTPHSYISACARALAVEFIAQGSAENLDATCAERIRRPRFLTELPERYALIGLKWRPL